MPRAAKALRLSRRAEADLEAIFDHTAGRWSVRQAVTYLAGVDTTLRGLTTGRRVGRDAGLGSGLMKINHEAHLIYYQAGVASIDVVRVLHAAMDAPCHLDE